jgi:hypothetical protein
LRAAARQPGARYTQIPAEPGYIILPAHKNAPVAALHQTPFAEPPLGKG